MMWSSSLFLPLLCSLPSFCVLMVLYSFLRLVLVFRCWTLWGPKARTSRAVSTVEMEPEVVDRVSDSSLSAGQRLWEVSWEKPEVNDPLSAGWDVSSTCSLFVQAWRGIGGSPSTFLPPLTLHSTSLASSPVLIFTSPVCFFLSFPVASFPLLPSFSSGSRYASDALVPFVLWIRRDRRSSRSSRDASLSLVGCDSTRLHRAQNLSHSWSRVLLFCWGRQRSHLSWSRSPPAWRTELWSRWWLAFS